MAEWAMAHPWLTFWLVMLAILALDNAISNLCQACKSIIEITFSKSTKEKPETEGGES